MPYANDYAPPPSAISTPYFVIVREYTIIHLYGKVKFGKFYPGYFFLFFNTIVQDRFIKELQLANESRAYDLSEKLGEVSRKVYQRKLLLTRIRDKTPCDCVEEFAAIEDYEDKVDEGYDSLLIRFDKIDEEQADTAFTIQVSDELRREPRLPVCVLLAD